MKKKCTNCGTVRINEEDDICQACAYPEYDEWMDKEIERDKRTEGQINNLALTLCRIYDLDNQIEEMEVTLEELYRQRDKRRQLIGTDLYTALENRAKALMVK